MATTPSRFKLGLFILIALGAAAAIAIALGVHLLRTNTVELRTYFDESVQGLDVGAPVKFRGVTVGSVAAIDVAPDRRHIEVVEELEVDELRRLGFAGDDMRPPAELRAQISPVGITGVKYLALDFFDPRTTLPPELPFRPPANYIPAAPSVVKSLEDAAMRAIERLPEIADAVGSAMSRLERMMASLERDEVSEKAAAALARANRVLASLERVTAGLDRAGLPARSARTLDELHESAVRVNALLDRLDGDDGLIASASRAAEAASDLGRSTTRASRELESTMRGIREAAEAVTDLAEALERDPDMLLKGRAKARR
ncbi:MAG: MCE family protein [Labilithrix sp.]|nr:MCE family protein [Labilithrix sp.]MCW5836626.1 MCE family protein [Labilithrix sp.]